MRISIKDPGTGKHYFANAGDSWVRSHDNGAIVSCGLTVGEDLSALSLRRMVRYGTAWEVSRDTWNHSGCQSECKLRGDATCRW